MSRDRDALEIDGVRGGDCVDKLRAKKDIVQGAGETSAGLADAAVFEAPGGYADGLQGGADVSGMLKRKARAPEPAVDVNDSGIWRRAGRKTEVAEVEGIGAVGNAAVRRGRG